MIRCFPDIFYLDLKDAFEASRLLDRSLGFEHRHRPRDGKAYQYGADELAAALKKGGHGETPPPRISAATPQIVRN